MVTTEGPAGDQLGRPLKSDQRETKRVGWSCEGKEREGGVKRVFYKHIKTLSFFFFLFSPC